MSKLQAILAGLVLAIASAPAFAEDAAAADEAATAESTSEEEAAAEATDEDETDEEEDDDELVAVPDRPTFSAAAATVDAGHAQLEAGAEFSTTDSVSQIAIPVLARVGVAEAFELRAGLPSIIIPLNDESSELGSVQLGGKIAGNVTDSLSLGAITQFDIASSAGDQTVFSQSTLGITGLWGYGLSDDFGIGGNVGVAMAPGSTEDAGPRELLTSVSLYAGYAIGDLGLTLEGFSVLGQYADATAGGSLSIGYAIAPHLVVDVYGGPSAQGGSTTVFAGAGVTYAR